MAKTFNLLTPADAETVIKSTWNERPFTVLNLTDKPIFNFFESESFIQYIQTTNF